MLNYATGTHTTALTTTSDYCTGCNVYVRVHGAGACSACECVVIVLLIASMCVRVCVCMCRADSMQHSLQALQTEKDTVEQMFDALQKHNDSLKIQHDQCVSCCSGYVVCTDCTISDFSSYIVWYWTTCMVVIYSVHLALMATFILYYVIQGLPAADEAGWGTQVHVTCHQGEGEQTAGYVVTDTITLLVYGMIFLLPYDMILLLVKHVT